MKRLTRVLSVQCDYVSNQQKLVLTDVQDSNWTMILEMSGAVDHHYAGEEVIVTILESP